MRDRARVLRFVPLRMSDVSLLRRRVPPRQDQSQSRSTLFEPSTSRFRLSTLSRDSWPVNQRHTVSWKNVTICVHQHRYITQSGYNL